MNRRAQTLVISLWILAMLTVLVVDTGQRVSIALRLSRYQRDKLKAYCLAKLSMNLAITELKKSNSNTYDSLDQPWAKTQSVAGDEERKININIASKELLLALLEECRIESAQEKVANICIWRGDTPDDRKIFETLGYPAKAAKFTNPEELKLVKGITLEDYQKLKGLVSVFGAAAINGEAALNINTASLETLNIFARGIAKKLGIGEGFADSLAAKVNDSRIANGPFKAKGEIVVAPTASEEINIFNSLINNVVFRSNYFLIEATGNVGRIKSRLESVYNRSGDNIVYWHES